MSDIEYKKPKNPDRPGRPPQGCIWVRAANGTIQKQGAKLGYRKMTDAEIAAAGKKKKSRVSKKTTRVAASTEEPRDILLRKGSYGTLSYDDLAKIEGWVQAAMERRKTAEKESVASQIKDLQAKLKTLT